MVLIAAILVRAALSAFFSLFPLILLFLLPALFFPRLRKVYGSLFSGFARALGSAVGGASRASTRGMSRRSDPRSVEVRTFRLVDSSGGSHHCTMTGTPRGADLRNGDQVRVSGHRSMSGEWKVRKVEHLSNGATIRASTPLGARSGRMLWMAALGVLVLDIIVIKAWFL